MPNIASSDPINFGIIKLYKIANIDVLKARLLANVFEFNELLVARATATFKLHRRRAPGNCVSLVEPLSLFGRRQQHLLLVLVQHLMQKLPDRQEQLLAARVREIEIVVEVVVRDAAVHLNQSF